jgi:hypothetical protein
MAMNICKRFKRYVCEYIEKTLSQEDLASFKSHIEHCDDCQAELSRALKFYETLDKDIVPEPEPAYFDNLKIKIREGIRLKNPFRIPSLVRVFVPVMAGALLLFFILRPEKTVEISVPTSVLLEDETIARLSLSGIVNDKLITELIFVEDSLPFDIEEALSELTVQETQEFIKLLKEQLGSSQEEV